MSASPGRPSRPDNRPRVLFLNPPHNRRVIRDCYCSHEVKGPYYWHQLDLQVQSAILSEHADVRVIDSIAEHLGANETIEKARQASPDWVLLLVGDCVWQDDLAFAERLHEALPEARIVGSGDFFMADPAAALERTDALHAVLLDFGSDAFSLMVRGDPPQSDVALRGPKGIELLPRNSAELISYPIPPDYWFRTDLFRLPFYGGDPFYSLLTSYGCPYACSFCHVPALGYRLRPHAEVRAEIQVALARGIRRFYFRDATFGLPRQQTLELCRWMAETPRGLTFNCFSRVDVLDRDLLQAMALAGCGVIQVGVETLDESAAAAAGKETDRDQIRTLIRTCRGLGILTSMHLLLGLPNDRWIGSDRALRDVIDLDPDFISLNVLYPRPGSEMAGLGSCPSAVERARLQTEAGRWHRRFYLRPRRVLSELRRMRSPADLLQASRAAAIALRRNR